MSRKCNFSLSVAIYIDTDIGKKNIIWNEFIIPTAVLYYCYLHGPGVFNTLDNKPTTTISMYMRPNLVQFLDSLVVTKCSFMFN